MKNNETNPMLANVLNFIGLIEILLLPIFAVGLIWDSGLTMIKLMPSDLVALAMTIVIYWVLCYVQKENR